MTATEHKDHLKTEQHNTEEYDYIRENDFQSVMDQPLSTFAIDVDQASYSNVRRYLNNNMLPPKDAVRLEELINYFHYDFPQEESGPCAVLTEVAPCPWNENNHLLQVGLKARDLPTEELPASNFVFLIDVSGSMASFNKLPLLKNAFHLFVEQLRPEDRVAIVVYAGASGLVLPSTSGNEKRRILAALDGLAAGGSTAGASGIELAYKVAHENFIPEGNNRIILATDGDFNVGPSSNGQLVRLIEAKRKGGVYLSVLGFGMGNYKDAKVEKLADHGNGNYAYIDGMQEAKKVLVTEFSSTTFTVANDVKLQLEFNPARVEKYRLIGYENRLMAAEDFIDDTKDAGEMGAGHSVVALYEIVPAQGPSSASIPLKYQNRKISREAAKDQDWATIKLRYKRPRSEVSQEKIYTTRNEGGAWQAASNNLRFAASVAGYGLLLRDSKYKGNVNFDWVIREASAAKGRDPHEYRAEFIDLARKASALYREGVSYEADGR